MLGTNAHTFFRVTLKYVVQVFDCVKLDAQVLIYIYIYIYIYI